jgi:hypothetical protein
MGCCGWKDTSATNHHPIPLGRPRRNRLVQYRWRFALGVSAAVGAGGKKGSPTSTSLEGTHSFAKREARTLSAQDGNAAKATIAA